jgi:hypothetical protein
MSDDTKIVLRVNTPHYQDTEVAVDAVEEQLLKSSSKSTSIHD